MKIFSSKIILLGIIILTLPAAHSKEEALRLAKSDLQVLSNNIQIGQNNLDKNRRDLEVTRETFLRKNLIIGSGGNIETPATQNNPEVRNCGCARHIGTLPFTPNTQLLCIEFCDNDQDSNGAWLNMVFCGKVALQNQNQEEEEEESLIPISATYTRLFVSNSNVNDSSLWANYTVIRDDEGSDNPPYGANISSFDFINSQYPYPIDSKVYVGLYDDDDNDIAFYTKQYDYLFQEGCLFVDSTSCNIKNISVVDIPQDFFSLHPALQEKIIYVVTVVECGNIFQVFGIAHLLAMYPELVDMLTEFLLSEDEDLINEACYFISIIWYYLYVAMII
ncbi:hypothetical protein K2W90_03270 [Candidatus Babeliales bacterium]|nr:hypothetical protein [Candidatus Babeliales bacterium]